MVNGGTWIERDIFLSPSYLRLKGTAPQVLVIFYGKRKFIKVKSKKNNKKSICTNCDHITFTYKEAESLGLSKPQFTRAIDELLAKGFISIVHQGGSYKKDKTVYKISEKWRIWKPGNVFETRNKDSIKRGYQGKK